MYNPVMELAAQLSEIVPASHVHARWIDRIVYANDTSYFRLMPQAVVQPKYISEFQCLCRFTQQHKIPMRFRAAGTSLSASATEKEAIEVNSRPYDGYYSSKITCEIGMSEATGKDYHSIIYLMERASRT